jgi:Ku70/Ku80 beta-barrel domain
MKRGVDRQLRANLRGKSTEGRRLTGSGFFFEAFFRVDGNTRSGAAATSGNDKGWYPFRFQYLVGAGDCKMAPRAYWKGLLKLSLVSCPVALYPASTAAEKTRFYMINRETGNRLKQQMVDAETGDVVEGDQKGRGYELTKGKYVQVEKDELEAVQIESNHTIDIDSFVPADEIDKR